MRYIIIVLSLSLLLASCNMFYSTKNPIETVYHYGNNSSNNSNKTLVIFMPGFWDDPQDFVEQGFVSSLQTRYPSVDIVAVEAYISYYEEGILWDRLKEDIINPAKTKGYNNIWMVGISMGGGGSIIYCRRYPEDIDGVLLLAPYLGEGYALEEIKKAGGIKKWTPPENIDPIEDYSRDLWKWLKDHYYINKLKNPIIFIGFGSDDDNSVQAKMLGEILPNDRLYEFQGDHDWSMEEIFFEIFGN